MIRPKYRIISPPENDYWVKATFHNVKPQQVHLLLQLTTPPPPRPGATTAPMSAIHFIELRPICNPRCHPEGSSEFLTDFRQIEHCVAASSQCSINGENLCKLDYWCKMTFNSWFLKYFSYLRTNNKLCLWDNEGMTSLIFFTFLIF